MKLDLYQVDAFTSKLFKGNPAAVIPLKKWLDSALMQQLAMENNLSETVFFVPSSVKGVDYDIRWFTPAVEVNLCGHATLASAYVIFNVLKTKKKNITFSCKSGLLNISRNKKLIRMDFPSWLPEKLNEYDPRMSQALGGVEIVGVYKHRDLLIELVDEAAVANCNPDFNLLQEIFDKVIVTAPGKNCDFVSRFFAPGAGINEDPVTGSAHSQLIPFWNAKLGKPVMRAKQLSARGGELDCEQVNAERVAMAGECVFFMKGRIEI